MEREQAVAELEARWAEGERFSGDRAPLLGGGGRASARLGPDRAHARRPRRRAALGAPERPTGHVKALGALTGNQAVQMVRGGPAGDLPLGLAGRRRREPRPRPPTPTRASTPPTASRGRAADQQRAAARRPDPVGRGGRRDRLARPDRRRRRGRLRGSAERVRADEVADRGRRRRRPLRGPARGREEVRPPRRQGARPHQPVRAHAGGGPARRGRLRHPDRPGRPHRRALGDAAHERHRPGRPPFLTGERTERGLLRRPRRARGRDRALARLRALRRRALVRDLRARPRAGARAFAEAIHARFPGKILAYNCSPSFNWRRNLDDRQIAAFQDELARCGYRFQFITLAGFHALNASMFELARGYAAEGMTRLRRAPGARVRARRARLHGHAPPARGGRELLRPGGDDDLGRRVLDARARRLDRGGPVRGRTGLSGPGLLARSRGRTATAPARRMRGCRPSSICSRRRCAPTRSTSRRSSRGSRPS